MFARQLFELQGCTRTGTGECFNWCVLLENGHCLSLCIGHKKKTREAFVWRTVQGRDPLGIHPSTWAMFRKQPNHKAAPLKFTHRSWRLQVQIYEEDFRKERSDRERLNEEKEALQKINERLQSQLSKLSSQVWVKRKLPLPAHVYFIFFFLTFHTTQGFLASINWHWILYEVTTWDEIILK